MTAICAELPLRVDLSRTMPRPSRWIRLSQRNFTPLFALPTPRRLLLRCQDSQSETAQRRRGLAGLSPFRRLLGPRMVLLWMRRRAKARTLALDQRRRSNVSFEGFKNHQPELWHGLERPDLDRIELVIEIVRQRTAPDHRAAGEPQPLTVLAYRVDQFIHTVAQALAEFAGDFHRPGDLSQELDQRAGSPVFLFIVGHGFRPHKLTLSA